MLEVRHDDDDDDDTHETLVPFEVIFSSCNVLVLPFQQLLEGPIQDVLCEQIYDLRHIPLSSPQLSHNDSLWA